MYIGLCKTKAAADKKATDDANEAAGGFGEGQNLVSRGRGGRSGGRGSASASGRGGVTPGGGAITQGTSVGATPRSRGGAGKFEIHHQRPAACSPVLTGAQDRSVAGTLR